MKVFLPRRYGAVFTENDLKSINHKNSFTSPYIPGQLPGVKFLHFRDRIVLIENLILLSSSSISNFQMPSLHETDLLRLLVPITYMIMGHAYAVIRVLRKGDVIFVVMKHI